MSTLATSPPASRRPVPPALAAAAAAAIGVMVAVTWGGLGVFSLPGLALLALAAGTMGWIVLTRATWLPVMLLPALIPIPLVGTLFPFEYMLLAVAGVLVVDLLRTESDRAFRLSHWEVANFAFVAWALFTSLWTFDTVYLLVGARRLLIGVAAGWVAYRLAGRAPRRAFETGLVLGTILIASAALTRSALSGMTVRETMFHRASATDLGWGTANYVATLLLLLTPPAFAIMISPRPRWLRVGAAVGIVLAGALQVLVASRAATVLFFVGLFVQVMLTLSRRKRIVGGAAVIGAIAIALLSPYGAGLLGRFTAPRDLGSMVVRIWYFREGWRRIVDFFPFGMGLNQGIPYPDKMAGTDLHNYWLAVTSELGLPGLLLWATALVVQFRALRRLRRDESNRAFGRALQVAFWLGQLHTLVEPTFQGLQYQFLWFWIAAGFLGYARFEGEAAAAISER